MSIPRVLADRRFLAILAVLATTGAGLALLAPNVVAAAIPLLIVAACPLSMVVMMRTMGDHQSNPSMGPDVSGGPQSRLRDRLAATQLEQRQLEQELTRIDDGDRATP